MRAKNHPFLFSHPFILFAHVRFYLCVENVGKDDVVPSVERGAVLAAVVEHFHNVAVLEERFEAHGEHGVAKLGDVKDVRGVLRGDLLSNGEEGGAGQNTGPPKAVRSGEERGSGTGRNAEAG